MLADKNCHCEKSDYDLRSRDSDRHAKVKTLFFLLLLRTKLVARSFSCGGGREE